MGYHLPKSCSTTPKRFRKLAASNGLVTRDTFLLPSDVRNICHKRAEEQWEKHPFDPVSVRMWANENPKNLFYYQEHSLMDLNSQSQDDSPFTIGVQTEWQLEMMAKFGHNSALSIDATIGTNQTRVRLKSMSFNAWSCIFHCHWLMLICSTVVSCQSVFEFLFHPNWPLF